MSKRKADKRCVTCGEPIPVGAANNRKYCSNICKIRARDPEKKRAQTLARRARLGEEETKRRQNECMQRYKAKHPEYKAAQIKSKKAWRTKNPDKLKEQRRRDNVKRGMKNAHVLCYRKHLLAMKSKHDAHVRLFNNWAKTQTAGWWMRHLKDTSGKLWLNPKISSAAKYRIHYRLSVEFRLKEINRSTWRRDKLKERDDGTINFFAIARERKTCVYCGVKLTDDIKALDHLDPIAKGGENSINNVAVVCKACNAKKAAKDFEVWVDELPEERHCAAVSMYRKKKGRLPGQQPLVLEFE